MRYQIATTVSPDIRRKADELMRRGYSLRDIVSRGIDRFYQEMQEAPMDEVRDDWGGYIQADWRLTTDNRIEQVNYLTELAADLETTRPVECTAQEQVDWYCEESADQLPAWFTDHDRALLVRFMEED